MLAGCVRALVAHDFQVAVIARSSSSYMTLLGSIPEPDRARLRFYCCDYRNLDELESTLSQLDPQPTGAICWVHDPAEPVLACVFGCFSEIDLIQVVGSSTQTPDTPKGTHKHRIVQLGFVIETGRSRWLTHAEISAGVFDAFVSGSAASRIGVTEPWERRP